MTAQTQSNVPLLGPLEKVIATTVAVAIVIGIILLLLWRFVFLTIPAGHVGVLFSLLGGGTVKEWVMHEGIAMKWPWNRVFLFEVRTQRIPVRGHCAVGRRHDRHRRRGRVLPPEAGRHARGACPPLVRTIRTGSFCR